MMIEPLVFSVSVAESAGEVVVSVTGELDMATVADLEACLGAVDPAGRRVVVDLSGLAFMDSSGIGAIVATHRRTASSGGSLVIRGCSRQVRRVLAMTGADAVVTVQD